MFSEIHLTSRRLALICVVAVCIATGSRSSAQSQPVTITLSVPKVVAAAISDDLQNGFMANNPNITVQIVPQTSESVTEASFNIDDHLNGVKKFVSQADVVLADNIMSPDTISPEGTRAGYFLNLQPLISTDPQFNSSDFRPQLLKAFAWDNGTWALPVSADPIVLAYDPTAFDKAGLNYPTDTWSVDDFIQAVQALTVKDGQGNIVTSGLQPFVGNRQNALYASLLNKPLYDSSVIPNAPVVDQPDTQQLLARLTDLAKMMAHPPSVEVDPPMAIEPLSMLNRAATTRKGSLLPGGHAYLSVTALAVSGASEHPDQAYALVHFLLGDNALTRLSPIPAQLSAPGAPIAPALQPLADKALTHGLSAADTRYGEYFAAAVIKTGVEVAQGQNFLADQQQAAVHNQAVAQARKNDLSVGRSRCNADPDAGCQPIGHQLRLGFLQPVFKRHVRYSAVCRSVRVVRSEQERKGQPDR